MASDGMVLNFMKNLGIRGLYRIGSKGREKAASGRFGGLNPATTLQQQCFVVLDCETTGFNPDQGDRVISLAAVRLKGGEIQEKKFSALVNPQREIPEIVTSLTGINGQMVRYQPVLEAILPGFLEFIKGGIVTGYNVGFDLAFLNNGLAAAGKEPICAAHSLDVFVLGRLLHPTWHHRLLEDMAAAYDVPVEGRHTALGDAIITAQLLQVMISQLEQQGIKNLRDLADFLFYCSLY